MPEPLAPTVRRLGWLHFWNDFTLDFLSPLLPSGVGAAWLGVMEGAADASAQVLKIASGRASDRDGRRVPWLRWGYGLNALARPLSAVGLFVAWPWWIAGCRLADRIGKGVRGSAADALVADWTDKPQHARAYSRMRMMDHLGATAGALAAAAVAYAHPDWLPYAVAALVLPMLVQFFLLARLQERGPITTKTTIAGWWPADPATRRALWIVGVATLGRISPLVILADAAAGWELWTTCLAWAGLGLVQAGAAAVTGSLMERWGTPRILALAWAVGAMAFAGLAFLDGPARLVCAGGLGVLLGAVEGGEKTLVAAVVPAGERGTAFGALAIMAGAAGLLANGAVGLGLAAGGAGRLALLLPAGAGLTAALLVAARR